jgi:hypothetical protein
MAKPRHSRRHISRSRSYRGGSYTSASSYGSYVNGSPDSQFSRTFDQSGPYGARVGSEYVGAQGQLAQQPNSPSAEQLNLVQSAGKHRRSKQRRSKHRRSKRGGFLGQVINQAIVPLGLLGLQQTYRKKRTGGLKSRKVNRY